MFFKNLKIFSILFFICLALFIPQKFVSAENLTWTREECQIKCAQIGEDTIKQLRISEEKCAKNKNKDCSYFQKEIDAVKRRFGIQEDQAGDLDQKSAYCEGLGEQPKSNNEDFIQVYCYAPPITMNLEVPIGETQVTYGLIHYIQIIFQWGTKTIAVLAVLFIMFAGLQWLTSAGSTDAISKAKNRIKGAVIGLILVLLSVGLLNFINPALTNLSGFQIKMVPTIAQGTLWCKDTPNYSSIGLQVSDTSRMAQKAASTPPQVRAPISPTNEDKVGVCGVEYQTSTGGAICYGNNCEGGKHTYCLRRSGQVFQCVNAQILGNVDVSVSRVILWGIYKDTDKKIKSSRHGDTAIQKYYMLGVIKVNSFYFAYGPGEIYHSVQSFEQYLEQMKALEKAGEFFGYLLEFSLDKSIWQGWTDPEVVINREGRPIRAGRIYYDLDDIKKEFPKLNEADKEEFLNQLIKIDDFKDKTFELTIVHLSGTK